VSDDADVFGWPFGQEPSFIDGNGEIHPRIVGLFSHEHIGQIVAALDIGKVLLLERNTSAHEAHPVVVFFLGRDLQGGDNDVELAFGTFARAGRKPARTTGKEQADGAGRKIGRPHRGQNRRHQLRAAEWK